jgi:hypothetical protein
MNLLPPIHPLLPLAALDAESAEVLGNLKQALSLSNGTLI